MIEYETLDNFCYRSNVQWRMANSLLLATVFRIGFVILSYGSKVPAGIFVPSMAIGATFGRMVGIIVKATYRYVPTISSSFHDVNPYTQCLSSIWLVRSMPTRCSMYHPGHLRLLGGRCCSQVCSIPSALYAVVF